MLGGERFPPSTDGPQGLGLLVSISARSQSQKYCGALRVAKVALDF